MRRTRSEAMVTARLTILATTDVHMHLTNYDYHNGRKSAHMGLSATASLIRSARNTRQNTLLLDNGDFLQGSLLGDYAARHTHQPHPMITAMNELHYDAVNLGNHEFSFGVEYLESIIKQARFPCLSANTFRTADNAHLTTPWVILEKEIETDDGSTQKIKIGIMGVLPPQTALWEAQSLRGRIYITDMVQAAADAAQALRNAEADVVIVLAHCGIGALRAKVGDENAALAISALPGVDALVMGHVHQTFPGGQIRPEIGVDPLLGRLNGKPAIMPGVNGSALGIIDLNLCKYGKKNWRISNHTSQIETIYTRAPSGKARMIARPDPSVVAIAQDCHRKTLSWLRRPVAQTSRALHSYFAMISDCPIVQITNAAQIAHVTERLVGTQWQGLPVLSAAAPFKAGGRGGPDNYTFLPAGGMRRRNAADLYAHNNTLTALCLTGAQITQWLEHSAKAFHVIPNHSQNHALINEDLPSARFDTIRGITYEIDLYAHKNRVKNICYQGQPLNPKAQFILATTHFRQSGAGGYDMAKAAAVAMQECILNRDIVTRYFAKHGDRHHDPRPAWRFSAMEGASVLFDTAPQSSAYLHELENMRIDPLFVTPQGFKRYRLWL